MKKAAIAIVSTGLVLLVAWLAITQLGGRAMSADLSRVGQGEPAVVLAFENYSPPSMNAMEQLNQIRAKYEPDVHFLVADLGTPDGRAFSSNVGLQAGGAVLIDGAGSPVRIYFFSGDEWRRDLDRELRKLL